MQSEWTIEGEAGKGWDETSQSLEDRKITSGKIDFRSLEADELNFAVVVEDVTADIFTATPTVSPDSSVRIGATVDVVVSCSTPGATIRYTTDGSDPNGSSTIVANGATLTIANPSTLKVRATSAGALSSDIKVAQYVLQGVIATGGSTISDGGGFRTHTFLASGSFVVTNGGSVEYLVVGGGGSGGANSTTRSGGGGGAGGLLTGTVSLSAGTYAITVGAGGQALITQTSASDGGASSIGTTVSVTGGGAGASVSGTSAIAGRNGGSGGGGCCGGAGGTRVVGQGNVGGSSGSSGSANAGTGGGSSAAGTSVNANTANGGAGTASSITGTSTTYAVGGGVSLTPDVSVVANSGRGGAGARLQSSVRLGANGSSGIVVIRYALPQPVYPPNIPSTDSSLPTLRQEMALYRDGVRFFHGNVTNVRSVIRGDSHEHQVTVSGPWWFLEKVPLTSNILDGTGVSGERISYVFGTSSAGQDLKTSIEAAIDRAATLGCPVATIAGGSSVAAMTIYPRITLNQMTCGQAIAELVRLCPDAMVYFDYSAKPAQMKVVRRPTCATTTFDENTAPITSIDINPVIDLEVSQVKLPSVARSTTGLTVFNNQTAGADPTGENVTARQVITIAGPELDTFLPNDLFDSQTISKSNSFANLAHDSDSTCVGAASAAGLVRLPVSVSGGTILVWLSRSTISVSPDPYASSITRTIPAQKIVDKNGVTLVGYNLITSGEPADWSGVTYVPCTVSGTMLLMHTYDLLHGGTYTPKPDYIANAGFTQILTGYTSSGSSGDSVAYFTKPYSYSSFATTEAVGSSTVYRPADYSFINPPAGLADFLLLTQNWLPYAGEIVLEEEDVGATRYAGTKVNITNSLPAFSTMGALVAGETIEIESGRTTIQLGAPPRNDYRTLVDKIRKTSQDNIVYL
jgi:hypothetical protein